MVDDLSLFFHSVLQLKSVKRAGWLSKVEVKDSESVADHTFSVCAMIMLLSDTVGLNTERAMKMAILHDLAESRIGDYRPGDINPKEKLAQEKKAMKSILSGLPKKTRSQYEKIWLEYLMNKTGVAKIVHRIDKLEMALQADQYAKQGYARNLFGPFFESAKSAVGDEGDIVSKILNSLRPTSARK